MTMAPQGHRQPLGRRPLKALEGKLQLPPAANINHACRVPFCKNAGMPWAVGEKSATPSVSGDMPPTPSRQGEKATASDYQPAPAMGVVPERPQFFSLRGCSANETFCGPCSKLRYGHRTGASARMSRAVSAALALARRSPAR
jgi:hypothetical protein